MSALDNVVRHRRGWQGTATLISGSLSSTTILNVNFDHADVHTLEFHVDPPSNSGPPPFGPPVPGLYNAVATITWTVGGNQIIRQVSVTNGTSISGTAEGCIVQIADDTPDPGIEKQQFINLPYTVSVTISPGVRANTQQPPTLQANDTTGYYGVVTVVPDGAVYYVVPVSSGAVSVSITAIDGVTGEYPAGITLIQYSGAGLFFLSQAPVPNPSGWMPLYPGTGVIEIMNSGPNNILVSPVWGIDG